MIWCINILGTKYFFIRIISFFIIILNFSILNIFYIFNKYKNFFGKKFFQWALLLPAAVPAYIIAYTYTDFLEYAGPVQKILRGFFNYQNSSEYWFPEIRSMEGAIFVMSFVLYPYVYMTTRASFLTVPVSFFQTSLIYGRSSFSNASFLVS